MAEQYWTALATLNQVAGELGLPQVATVVSIGDVQSIQLLSMLNSSGNELMLYYPWEQFRKEWVIETAIDPAAAPGEYTLPDDWNYAVDQTQWDRSNHWPMIGPKSAQEWAWLKGGLLAAAPRMRFRIQNNKFMLWPIPQPDQPGFRIAQEYVVSNWLTTTDNFGNQQPASMIVKDTDLLMYNPWLLIKYVKYKFYELKGFETSGVQGDFMRVFNSLTGKDVGAPILSLTPQTMNQYLGPWSVPDGSWNVGQP